jgi:hypothetical protein
VLEVVAAFVMALAVSAVVVCQNVNIVLGQGSRTSEQLVGAALAVVERAPTYQLAGLPALVALPLMSWSLVVAFGCAVAAVFLVAIARYVPRGRRRPFIVQGAVIGPADRRRFRWLLAFELAIGASSAGSALVVFAAAAP